MGRALTIPTQILALPVTAGQAGTTLPAGIHLLWNLPDGLAKGEADPDETRGLHLPEVPDRWLVLRMGTPGADGKRALRGWLVDSWAGTSRPLAGNTATPPSAVPGQRLTVMGIVDNTGKLVSPPDPMAGPGAEGFSMYYPVAGRRFGLHDPLDDRPTGPVSYTVVGWYSEQARDPLFSAGTDWQRLQLMKASGWRVDGVTFAAAAQAQLDRSVMLESKVQLSTETKGAAPAAAPAASSPKDVKMGTTATAAAPAAAPAASSPKDVKMGTTATATASTAATASKDAKLNTAAAGTAPASTAPASTAPASTAPASTAPASTASAQTSNGVALRTFEPPPDHIVVHGLLSNVPVGTAGGSFRSIDSPLPQPSRVDFTVGDSLADALGSLLTDQHELSWLLRVLQGMGLRSLQSLDGLASIQAELHRQGFHSLDRKATESAPGKTASSPTTALAGISISKPAPTASFREGTFWNAAPPLLMALNAGRSFRYGHDGRYEQDGKVKCRITGQKVQSLPLRNVPLPSNPSAMTTWDVLPGTIAALPTELKAFDPAVTELVEEALMLDPVSAPSCGVRRTDGSAPALRQAFLTESTWWWAAGLPGTDPQDVKGRSAYQGTLPSPLAISPWNDPWGTLYLEYEGNLLEAAGNPGQDWSLGEVERTAPASPTFGPSPLPIRGQAPAEDGGPSVLSGLLEQLMLTPGLMQELGPEAANALEEQIKVLRALNVLSFDLAGLDHALRMAGRSLRAGALSFTALRLVDAFGRKVALDLNRFRAAPGSILSVPGGSGLALPPRCLQPGRVDLAWLKADNDAVRASASASPLCGWLMADPVDRALEVFTADGKSQGQLRVGAGGRVLFEPAPGRDALLSEQGVAGNWNPHLKRVVNSLLQLTLSIPKGTPDPLSTLLALLDAVRHTVDRRGSTEEQLALLLGAPIAVVRARVAVQVDASPAASSTPLATTTGTGPTKTKGATGNLTLSSAPASTPAGTSAAQGTSGGSGPLISVRLGALAQLDDGLLGYLVDSDPTHLQTALVGTTRLDAPGYGVQAALSDLPYLAPGAELRLTAEGAPALVTLLMMPGSGVYFTSGVFPRSRASLEKAWLDQGLKELVPTFTFGPLLIEPGQLRLPSPGADRLAWEWVYRRKPEGVSDGWDSLEVGEASDRALYPAGAVLVQEGWLRGTPKST